MSDRELLEMAAKGAGLQIFGWVDSYDVSRGDPLYEYAGPVIGEHSLAEKFGVSAIYHGQPWNPLLDDGDALRLAAHLKIRIDPEFHLPADEFGYAQKFATVWLPGESGIPSLYGFGSDPMEVMRQLIVMAAAEIGRKMP